MLPSVAGAPHGQPVMPRTASSAADRGRILAAPLIGSAAVKSSANKKRLAGSLVTESNVIRCASAPVAADMRARR
jgi:hypothetical protein